MLEEMMGQLLSKEVLYEPLKELDDKVINRIIMSLHSLIPLKVPGVHNGKRIKAIDR